MDIALVTGSAGLIGADAVRFLSTRGFRILGFDNDMRQVWDAEWSRRQLEAEIPNYFHYDADIRDESRIASIFSHAG